MKWFSLLPLLLCRVSAEVSLSAFTRLVDNVDAFEDKFIQDSRIQEQFSNISSLVRFRKSLSRPDQVLTVPVSDALMDEISSHMLLVRKKEVVDLIGRHNKHLWVGYDLSYIQQVLKQLCQTQHWTYKAIQAQDVLVPSLIVMLETTHPLRPGQQTIPGQLLRQLDGHCEGSQPTHPLLHRPHRRHSGRLLVLLRQDTPEHGHALAGDQHSHPPVIRQLHHSTRHRRPSEHRRGHPLETQLQKCLRLLPAVEKHQTTSSG